MAETMSSSGGDYGYSRELCLNVVATTLGLTYSAYRQLRAAQTLPPGPWGVPFLGYAPFLSNHCTYLKYNELARRYGPICSFTQRGNTVILLSDHKLIKTAFDMKQITGRPNDGYMDIIGGYGECFFFFFSIGSIIFFSSKKYLKNLKEKLIFFKKIITNSYVDLTHLTFQKRAIYGTP